MKVYVLVKLFDDGSFGGRPTLSSWVFPTMDAAKEAMQKKIADIKEDCDIDEDSIEEDDTSFYAYTNDCHQYGMSDVYKLEIHENEIN